MTNHVLPPQVSSRLESLRGLAAIQVAMYHSSLVLGTSPSPEKGGIPVMLVLFNGRAAVTLFFVLSGLVLGLSLRRSHGSFGNVYLTFAIRRIARIYPAFLVSSVLLALFWWVYPSYFGVMASEWADHYVPVTITRSMILQQLSFVNNQLNGVTWTLKLEILGSPILLF